MTDHHPQSPSATMQDDRAYDDEEPIDFAEFLSPLARHRRLWLAATVLAGVLGGAGSYLIKPEFTSVTTFLPPQQQQSMAASALSSLGALAGLGGGGAMKSPADQFVALMQSVTVADRLVDRFKLMQVYEAKFRVVARKDLAAHSQMDIGKKDGLITVRFSDTDRQRAAAVANGYVEELRRMTSVLAVSEAQQRRMFFEKQVQDTKARLVDAQTALQASGFTPGAMKAEPRAAADEYARLRAEMTGAEVRLQTLRNSLTETSPEVAQQSATLQALRSKVEQLEQSSTADKSGPDYVSKYREFKYQETLFDLMAKQYEIARVDESREGALIQVVDPAEPPELKSKPKRLMMALGSAFAGAALMAIYLIVRARRQLAAASR
jgi:uncharacterized protein involved in exopolysaccharide biosynthesis